MPRTLDDLTTDVGEAWDTPDGERIVVPFARSAALGKRVAPNDAWVAGEASHAIATAMIALGPDATDDAVDELAEQQVRGRIARSKITPAELYELAGLDSEDPDAQYAAMNKQERRETIAKTLTPFGLVLPRPAAVSRKACPASAPRRHSRRSSVPSRPGARSTRRRV